MHELDCSFYFLMTMISKGARPERTAQPQPKTTLWGSSRTTHDIFAVHSAPWKGSSINAHDNVVGLWTAKRYSAPWKGSSITTHDILAGHWIAKQTWMHKSLFWYLLKKNYFNSIPQKQNERGAFGTALVRKLLNGLLNELHSAYQQRGSFCFQQPLRRYH